MMDIYAKEGTKVKGYFKKGKILNGMPDDQELASKYIKEGETYTVEKTSVSSWSSLVYLKEFPGIAFNTVHFKSA